MIDLSEVNHPDHYFFLASPYTHEKPEVMEERFQKALDATAWLLKGRVWTYSPIVHCHTIGKTHALPTTSDYWYDYNAVMLKRALGLIVLCSAGFYESKGCRGEVKQELENQHEFRDVRLPIQTLTPIGDTDYRLEFANPYAE